MSVNERANFGSKIGVILASAGSAVGFVVGSVVGEVAGASVGDVVGWVVGAVVGLAVGAGVAASTLMVIVPEAVTPSTVTLAVIVNVPTSLYENLQFAPVVPSTPVPLHFTSAAYLLPRLTAAVRVTSSPVCTVVLGAETDTLINMAVTDRFCLKFLSVREGVVTPSLHLRKT